MVLHDFDNDLEKCANTSSIHLLEQLLKGKCFHRDTVTNLSRCPTHALGNADYSYKGNIDVPVYDIFAKWSTCKRLLNNSEGMVCVYWISVDKDYIDVAICEQLFVSHGTFKLNAIAEGCIHRLLYCVFLPWNVNTVHGRHIHIVIHLRQGILTFPFYTLRLVK